MITPSLKSGETKQGLAMVYSSNILFARLIEEWFYYTKKLEKEEFII